MIPRYLANFNLSEIKKVKTDFIVVGTGIAGLISTLNLSTAGEVTLLTKGELEDCNTQQAQGGIAAVVSEFDTTRSHYKDTLKAGAGLCNSKAVKQLVEEGSQQIKELMELGMQFDQQARELALTKEGGHSCSRVLHAGGDATGRELRYFLAGQVLGLPRVNVNKEEFVIDLLTEGEECYGVLAYNEDEGLVAYLAQSVVLATGGAGQLYSATSNPQAATGDGIAMAYRAGVEVMDMEFIQFHPTTLQLEGAPNFLISEAVRGEGAVLRNHSGTRFMPDYHKLADLAPRDIVARAIYQEMNQANSDHAYLDVTELNADFVKDRFPTIYQKCLETGIDITSEYIPVAPAAHYLMGGIKTDLTGETNLARLFACGETACLGVHGANRLASNSLLEGLVYGKRVADEAKQYLAKKTELEGLDLSFQEQKGTQISIDKVKEELNDIMIDKVGIVRSKSGLKEALNKLETLLKNLNYSFNSFVDFEIQNLLLVAYLTVKAALLREESRGAHYRKDIPISSSDWQKHIVFQIEQSWEGLNLEFE
ncbi:L-aspartate oxidase [Halanaerocella petrolearia]